MYRSSARPFSRPAAERSVRVPFRTVGRQPFLRPRAQEPAFASSLKGENAIAATLAKILERTWDKSEDYGGDTALSKTNHALFDEIDKAMDQFVNLLVEHQTSAPDSAKLKAVYNAYLEKLKRAD